MKRERESGVVILGKAVSFALFGDLFSNDLI